MAGLGMWPSVTELGRHTGGEGGGGLLGKLANCIKFMHSGKHPEWLYASISLRSISVFLQLYSSYRLLTPSLLTLGGPVMLCDHLQTSQEQEVQHNSRWAVKVSTQGFYGGGARICCVPGTPRRGRGRRHRAPEKGRQQGLFLPVSLTRSQAPS